MKTITYGTNIIEVSGMSLTAIEQVKYNGKIVSSKRSMLGATHIFEIEEDKQTVQYEIEIGTRWHGMSSWCTVRREGRVIFSDR